MTLRLASPRPATVFVWDGLEFDLTVSWLDAVGNQWTWSGTRNTAGEPLMFGQGGGRLWPLPDLYRDLGPLIPMLPRPRLNFGGLG